MPKSLVGRKIQLRHPKKGRGMKIKKSQRNFPIPMKKEV